MTAINMIRLLRSLEVTFNSMSPLLHHLGNRGPVYIIPFSYENGIEMLSYETALRYCRMQTA